MAKGAADMEEYLKSDTTENNIAFRYATARNSLHNNGYKIEMLSFFEPRLFRFAKWWVQLFGESEGKDGKGLYPTFGNFSEDLHSIGQFIQDGTHCLMETFIDVQCHDTSVVLHDDDIDDKFHYLDGMDYFDINKASYMGTLEAHSQILPCFTISIEAINEYCFGQLFYFFMFSCYLSGSLLGVNPFDQPGVEAYKARMFEKLGK
jgi:glucose-6-phosphate isomerase